MPPVLELGPVALPLPLLVAVAAIGLGLLAGSRAGRAAGIDARWPLVRALLVGLLAARAAHVWEWQESFVRNPAAALNIRDGGWNVALGAGAAFLYALALVKRDARLKRPFTRAGVVAASLGVVGTIGGLAWPGEAPRLPALSLQTLAGEAVALRSFEGKPAVVNLWASWCPPCRREMPLLAQTQAADRQLNVVFLNQGESAQAVQAFLLANRLRLGNVLLDPQLQAGNRLGRLALPTTLFFDANGRLVASRIGELTADELRMDLDRISGPR